MHPDCIACRCDPASRWSRLRGFVQGRADVEGCRTPQVSRVGVVVRTAAMHRAAVVPDHEIADLPFVAVDKFRPSGVRVEIDKQQTPFRNRPVDECEACAERYSVLRCEPG